MDETDQEQATATTNAGSSTALLTKCVSNFAQDDKFFRGFEGERATAKADPYGMTTKKRDDNKKMVSS